jgi:ATP-dependent DNA helicase RecG
MQESRADNTLFINRLDLILNTPKKYEDNYLADKLETGITVTVEIDILSIRKEVRVLKIKAKMLNFSRLLEISIFNSRPFHFNTYNKGNRLFVQAKLDWKFGFYHMINPRVVSSINKIIPIYRTKNIASKIEELDLSFLDRLLIPSRYKNRLHEIHFPNRNLAVSFNEFGYTDIHLETLKYIESFAHFYKLSTKKKDFPAKKKLTQKVKPFIDSLPFSLTNDQLNAINDIKKDFNSDTASKRVIVGDVGCGKTMVILASIYICYPNKSAVMAPTTILANQLYTEAVKYLPNLKIVIATNNQKVDDKDYDVIISTHAILYMQDLPSFDLVIIDEQHRFGTNQRETLSSFGKVGKSRAHFLQFSATPIPRTFAMLQSSLVDYSFIKETPFEKDVLTKVLLRSDFRKLKEHIKNELSQQKQVIIVYPLVEQSDTMNYLSIEESIGYWQKEFSGVYHTHGKDKNKEQILIEFKDNGSILVATTLIEVGISLPRLSTIVIVGAERLGLASLHQLRGRVSRNGLKGYCYLYTNSKNSKRLKEFVNTKNGFDISELDLKYRNSGDLLGGRVQSGREFRWVDISSDYNLTKDAKSNFLSFVDTFKP